MLQHEVQNYEGKTVYIDTETNGLYGEVTLVQIYCPELYTVVHSYQTKYIPLKLILNAVKDCKWVGHNLSYDFTVLNFVARKWEDTFLLSKLSYHYLDKLSLDSCLHHALGFNPYDDLGLDKHTMQTSDWSGELTQEQLSYAETDVFYLPKLFEDTKQDWLGQTVYELDKQTIETFCSMGERLPISKIKLQAQEAQNNLDIEALNCPINVNSHKQVKDYLNHYESNGDLQLAQMIATDPERAAKAKQVRKVRSLRKQNSFISKYIKSYPYLTGHLNVLPRSGRSNCSGDNLQQIPGSIKHTIESSEGYLVYADFAQLELRMLAALIGETTLDKLFKASEDLHNYAAKGLFGENFTKAERQIAKIYNFALGIMVQIKRVELLGHLRVLNLRQSAAKGI